MREQKRGRIYKRYKNMSKEEIAMIYKLYKEKMELRKIARVMNRALSSVQYQLKKNYKRV